MSHSNLICRTLGCKINQCETEKLKAILEETMRGDNSDKRQIVAVNTCCVTNRSEYESRQTVRQVISKFPDAVIIAAGCAVQKSPSSFAEIPGIDYILGNRDKMSLRDLHIQKQPVPVEKISCVDDDTIEITEAHTSEERTRAFVKIQDGCNSSCSYCIVPKVRGRSRSVPSQKVLSLLSSLISRGFREIVLTGIHLGQYGLELSPQTSLSALLKSVVSLPGNFRIRLSSIEPDDITEELLEILENPQMCGHLHIPLQSGNNNVLKRMNRHYTTSSFSRILEKLKKSNETISIGTDIIVGFPGETESEFLNTYDFLRSHPFSYFHVFRYSSRDGTKACAMPEQIHGTVKKERSFILRKLGEEKKHEFEKKFVGFTIPTLILSRDNEDGTFRGLTENYIHLPVSGEKIKVNEIIPVRIETDRKKIVGQSVTV